MKHEPPPGLPDEPPFMREFREIDRHITDQVNRYLRWARSFVPIIFGAAFIGQWVGWGTIWLLKWWAGLP